MALAIFDLDHTLIHGDSDHAWGEFVADKGLVDGASYRQRNDEFFRAYQAGALDIMAYQEFVLQPMCRLSMEEIDALHREFMSVKINRMRLPKADKLIARHRRAGDTLLIITATNHFITGPIGSALGIETVIATEGEIKNKRFTGRVKGVPCYQEGKVKRLENWLRDQNLSLDGDSYFYSDSHNDLPLLKLVTHPVAVDPDPTLLSFAQRMQWPVISLRENTLDR
jgi:HAD superfamily hydrolase (TIGR01490 family)